LYQKNAAVDGAIQLCLDSTTPDLDGDLLSHEDELELGTNTSNSDSDGDGFNDGQEVSYGTNPLAIVSESNIESNSNTDAVNPNLDDSTDESSNISNIESEGIDLKIIIAWTIGFTICSIVFLFAINTMNSNQKPMDKIEEE
ncbi:MAG TPA: thrombospondin type 3 repeat-containing protein, partial [Candidatus Poseidoniaceae archaeon]|nr:thrombospondin type 3 repeat-containing protein [Candidatus Poseidoniaceae archaeon]